MHDRLKDAEYNGYAPSHSAIASVCARLVACVVFVSTPRSRNRWPKPRVVEGEWGLILQDNQTYESRTSRIVLTLKYEMKIQALPQK